MSLSPQRGSDLTARELEVLAAWRDAGGDLDVTLSTNPDLIDAIKEALNKGSLSGVSAVWNTELEAHDEWEAQPFRDGMEVSQFRLWFSTAEARNG